MNIYKVALRWLFVLLMLMQIGVQTFLTHTHATNNGFIVHSHPFKQKNHSHSSNDLVFIHKLNQVVLTSDILHRIIIHSNDIVYATITVAPLSQIQYNEVSCQRSLRAPPVL